MALEIHHFQLKARRCEASPASQKPWHSLPGLQNASLVLVHVTSHTHICIYIYTYCIIIPTPKKAELCLLSQALQVTGISVFADTAAWHATNWLFQTWQE
jgi:hypothetical protein